MRWTPRRSGAAISYEIEYRAASHYEDTMSARGAELGPLLSALCVKLSEPHVLSDLLLGLPEITLSRLDERGAMEASASILPWLEVRLLEIDHAYLEWDEAADEEREIPLPEEIRVTFEAPDDRPRFWDGRGALLEIPSLGAPSIRDLYDALEGLIEETPCDEWAARFMITPRAIEGDPLEGGVTPPEAGVYVNGEGPISSAEYQRGWDRARCALKGGLT